jgi:hypothetical protein
VSSAFIVAVRRLRAPLILLVLLFSIGIVGLVMIPGTDPAGHPWRMTIFDALYFMSYTASTIGFGEIPHAFNRAQRVEILFAGRPAARSAQRSVLFNLNVRDYAVRGMDLPGGWLWQRLTRPTR